MDLFLDGWDDIDLSDWDDSTPKTNDWPKGNHPATITRAEYKTGEKNGNTWAALVLTINNTELGEKKNLYHFPPKPEWWGQQDYSTKQAIRAEWRALGIDPRKIDDEGARASIIGRNVTVGVYPNKKKPDEMNYRFRLASTQGSSGVPTQAERSQETGVSQVAPGVTL